MRISPPQIDLFTPENETAQLNYDVNAPYDDMEGIPTPFDNPPNARPSEEANNLLYLSSAVASNAEQYDKAIKFLNADDMAINAKAPDFLINDILETDTHGVMFGASQSFKSFNALSIAFSICTGAPFMGHDVYRTGKVVYVCGEGMGALSRRFKAMRLTNGDFNGNLLVVDGAIDIDVTNQMVNFEKALKQLQPALVIFDTFSALATNTDESDNPEVAKVLKLVKETCSNGLTTSIIVHHTGKDATKGARGASAFTANVDFSYQLERTNNPMQTTMSCIKNKDGEPFSGIVMTAEVIPLDIIRQDGKEATSLVLRLSDDSEKAKAKTRELTKLQQTMLTEMMRVIEEKGIQPPNGVLERFPDSQYNVPKKVIDEQTLKHDIHKIITSSNKTTSFRQTTEALIAAKKLGFYDGFYWITL